MHGIIPALTTFCTLTLLRIPPTWPLHRNLRSSSGSNRDMAEFFGLGKHVCHVPMNDSVYRIAILVPFDPRLEDISAAAPSEQVSLLLHQRFMHSSGWVKLGLMQTLLTVGIPRT